MAGNPTICSYCMGKVPKKHFVLRESEDPEAVAPMKFCNWRCLCIYAMQKGWKA